MGEILKVSMDVTGDSMDINLDSLGVTSRPSNHRLYRDTDSTFYPRAFQEGITGTDLVYIASGEEIPTPFVVYGKLRLTLASAAAAETVTMTITYRQ